MHLHRARASGSAHDATVAAGAHLPALDGVRGIAILLVMALHFFSTAGAAHSGGADAAERIVLKFTGTGWVGVDLFFVLSGFLITGILFDGRGGRGYFRNFYARRVLRIVPLYYAFLALAFIVLPLATRGSWVVPIADQAWYWAYLPDPRSLTGGGPANAFHGATGHIWSLMIEEQFYLLLPAVVALPLSRRQLMFACAVCAVTAFVIRCGIVLSGTNPAAAYRLMPARMDALAIGGFVALAARSPHDLALLRRWGRPALVAAAALLCALVVRSGGLPPAGPWVQTIGYTAIAVASAVLIISAIVPLQPGRRRVLLFRPLRALSRYAYGLYIIHVPLVLLLGWRAREAGGLPAVAGSYLPAALAFSAVAFAATLALAMLSWHLFEQRFLAMRWRFTATAVTPATARIGRRQSTGDADTAPGEEHRRAA
jgi:peptidoglycan/LPS O-acetylase OafA/YrhL